MSIELFIENLLSPPVLFFFLGIAATMVRSDLEIPAPIAKLFSLYLLWAIGFKGGVALRDAGLEWSALAPIGAAVAFSAIVPLVSFPLLRRAFNVHDACALAAAYGSVSVVTFVTAADFLEAREVVYGGEMVAALALMESPPIIVALMLRRFLLSRSASTDASPAGHDNGKGHSIRQLLHEALTNGPVFLLLGSFTAGLLMMPTGVEPLRSFSHDIFHGVLVLFLLEAGMVSGTRLRELMRMGVPAVGSGVLLPLVNAAAGIAISAMLGLSVGNAVMLTVLAASASYIAVPAVMRLAVPEANSGLYLPMALGVTFPFNVCVGIPLYLMIITWLWPEATPPV
ncbi:MAG: sodium-dependent bicarbonate transport family permease [Planctomycetota bacterium]